MLTALIYGIAGLFSLLLILRVYCRLTLGKFISDKDLSGKTILITGASAGIGKATAFALARRNARVLLACRNLEKAERVKSEIISATGNTNVAVKHIELESFESVRQCAKDVLRTEKRLDVLINNAGIVETCPKMTQDGYEKSMQVNHLSHFLLTLLLLDLLKKSAPSRIIIVTSVMYFLGILDLNDINGKKTNILMRLTANLYCRLKLANLLFTAELSSRLSGSGISVNAVHPGVVKTEIPINWSFAPIIRILMMFLGKTPEEAVHTIDYLAVHPDGEKKSGKFFYGCQEGIIVGKALDKKFAKKFFQMSEIIVGETCPSLQK